MHKSRTTRTPEDIAGLAVLQITSLLSATRRSASASRAASSLQHVSAADLQAWLEAFDFGSTLAAVAAIAIAWYGNVTNRRLAELQGRSEHKRWLLDKRREAYTEFLDKIRVAYETIESRAAVKTSLPAGGRDSVTREDVQMQMNITFHAEQVLRIVGPPTLADLAKSTRARLRVDRAYLSPVLEQRDKPNHMLEHAEDVGDQAFLQALRTAFAEQSWERVDAVMTEWRLNGFLDRFADKAAAIIQGEQDA